MSDSSDPRAPGRCVDEIFQLVCGQMAAETRATKATRTAIARRVAVEVERVCTESQRIQKSGDVNGWRHKLAQHRLNQCLRYYHLGSRRGRADLHATLSAMVYRYISTSRNRTRSTYQAKVQIIEDFLQGFYAESLEVFRRENEVGPTYTPRVSLELAEYMAFIERYAKRRIPLPGGRGQQLIILRAQTFTKHQPSEMTVDLDRATESAGDDRVLWEDSMVREVRERMAESDGSDLDEEALRDTVVRQLYDYLLDRDQKDCADYLALRLEDLTAGEIEAILDLTPRERDYLQQRFKYHLLRFALLHHWRLVHQWLDADLETDLGLEVQQWDRLLETLDESGQKVLLLKREGLEDEAIAQQLDLSVVKVERLWFKVLETAWTIRNHFDSSPSGPGESTDE